MLSWFFPPGNYNIGSAQPNNRFCRARQLAGYHTGHYSCITFRVFGRLAGNTLSPANDSPIQQFTFGKAFRFLLSSLYIWFYVSPPWLPGIGRWFQFERAPTDTANVLIVILVLLAAITARSGIEVIGRLAESSFALVISYLADPCSASKFRSPEYLQPALARGVPRAKSSLDS